MSDGVNAQHSAASGSLHQEDVTAQPSVRLLLPALPANVALVRQALAGLAEELGVDPARAADMKVALTEAVLNVVVPCGGEPGSLEVTMAIEHGRLVLSVRSELRIAFALSIRGAPPLAIRPSAGAAPACDAIVVTLGPPVRSAPVLGRVVSLAAARAHFSIDRLCDAQIVSDAIAGAAAAHLAGGLLHVTIDERERGFDLLLGPFAPGGAQRLVDETALPGLGSLLERLTDELAVERTDGAGGERLRVRLLARA